MLTASSITIWVASCDDRAGGAAARLEKLAMHGIDLEFILAQRMDHPHAEGSVFIAPIVGEREEALATSAGFTPAKDLHMVRVEGMNEPGLGYQLTQALGSVGVSVRAVSAMTFSSRFIAYLVVDSDADAKRAIARLMEPL